MICANHLNYFGSTPAAGVLCSSLAETEGSLSMVVDSSLFLFQGDFTD